MLFYLKPGDQVELKLRHWTAPKTLTLREYQTFGLGGVIDSRRLIFCDGNNKHEMFIKNGYDGKMADGEIDYVKLIW
jgi:hypothetical protein